MSLGLPIDLLGHILQYITGDATGLQLYSTVCTQYRLATLGACTSIRLKIRAPWPPIDRLLLLLQGRQRLKRADFAATDLMWPQLTQVDAGVLCRAMPVQRAEQECSVRNCVGGIGISVKLGIRRKVSSICVTHVPQTP